MSKSKRSFKMVFFENGWIKSLRRGRKGGVGIAAKIVEARGKVSEEEARSEQGCSGNLRGEWISSSLDATRPTFHRDTVEDKEGEEGRRSPRGEVPGRRVNLTNKLSKEVAIIVPRLCHVSRNNGQLVHVAIPNRRYHLLTVL